LDRQEFGPGYAEAEQNFLNDVYAEVWQANDQETDVAEIHLFRDPANGERQLTTLRRDLGIQDDDPGDLAIAWRDQYIQQYGQDSNSRVVGDSRGRWFTINPRRFVGQPAEMLERQDTGRGNRHFVGIVDIVDEMRDWDQDLVDQHGQPFTDQVEFYGFLVDWRLVPRRERRFPGRREGIEARTIDSMFVQLDRAEFPTPEAVEEEARRWMSQHYPQDIEQRQGSRLSPQQEDDIMGRQSAAVQASAHLPSEAPTHHTVEQADPARVLGHSGQQIQPIWQDPNAGLGHASHPSEVGIAATDRYDIVAAQGARPSRQAGARLDGIAPRSGDRSRSLRPGQTPTPAAAPPGPAARPGMLRVRAAGGAPGGPRPPGPPVGPSSPALPRADDKQLTIMRATEVNLERALAASTVRERAGLLNAAAEGAASEHVTYADQVAAAAGPLIVEIPEEERAAMDMPPGFPAPRWRPAMTGEIDMQSGERLSVEEFVRRLNERNSEAERAQRLDWIFREVVDLEKTLEADQKKLEQPVNEKEPHPNTTVDPLQERARIMWLDTLREDLANEDYTAENSGRVGEALYGEHLRKAQAAADAVYTRLPKAALPTPEKTESEIVPETGQDYLSLLDNFTSTSAKERLTALGVLRDRALTYQKIELDQSADKLTYVAKPTLLARHAPSKLSEAVPGATDNEQTEIQPAVTLEDPDMAKFAEELSKAFREAHEAHDKYVRRIRVQPNTSPEPEEQLRRAAEEAQRREDLQVGGIEAQRRRDLAEPVEAEVVQYPEAEAAQRARVAQLSQDAGPGQRFEPASGSQLPGDRIIAANEARARERVAAAGGLVSPLGQPLNVGSRRPAGGSAFRPAGPPDEPGPEVAAPEPEAPPEPSADQAGEPEPAPAEQARPAGTGSATRPAGPPEGVTDADARIEIVDPLAEARARIRQITRGDDEPGTAETAEERDSRFDELDGRFGDLLANLPTVGGSRRARQQPFRELADRAVREGFAHWPANWTGDPADLQPEDDDRSREWVEAFKDTLNPNR
jgi:hypothetical protein